MNYSVTTHGALVKGIYKKLHISLVAGFEPATSRVINPCALPVELHERTTLTLYYVVVATTYLKRYTTMMWASTAARCYWRSFRPTRSCEVVFVHPLLQLVKRVRIHYLYARMEDCHTAVYAVPVVVSRMVHEAHLAVRIARVRPFDVQNYDLHGASKSCR